MNATKTIRNFLIVATLILVSNAAWALPPCSLCAYLPAGHLCFEPNGELGSCPSSHVTAGEATAQSFGAAEFGLFLDLGTEDAVGNFFAGAVTRVQPSKAAEPAASEVQPVNGSEVCDPEADSDEVENRLDS